MQQHTKSRYLFFNSRWQVVSILRKKKGEDKVIVRLQEYLDHDIALMWRFKKKEEEKKSKWHDEMIKRTKNLFGHLIAGMWSWFRNRFVWLINWMWLRIFLFLFLSCLYIFFFLFSFYWGCCILLCFIFYYW